MCYNYQVSRDTFLLSLYAAYFIWRDNQLWALAFWMSFVSMQFVEYFLWQNIHNPPLNHLWSWMGLILICLQPSMSIMASNMRKQKKHYLLAGYSLLVLYMIISAKNVYTTVGPNGHLLWKWLVSYPVWVIVLWCLFLIIPLFSGTSWMAGLFTFLVLLVSLYYYYKEGTWGTMWCWMATSASFYIIYRGIYHTK